MPGNDFASVKDMRVEMHDWKTVRSHEKTENIVPVWYKPINTNKECTVASIICISAIGIKDGKTIEIKAYSKY